jgi:DNA polymerase-3 subunit epsilon
MPDPMSRPFKVIWNDTETTGLTELHGLHQWSAKVFIDGVEKESIDLKMRPYMTDLIEDSALEASHVTREELFADDRLEPDVAYKAIIALCGRYVDKFDRKDKFIWKGFNSRFDMDRTRDFFLKNNDTYFGSWFWFPPADIMGLAIHILQRERVRLDDFKQKTVWEYLHPTLKDKYKEEEWHDALFDLDRCRDIETALRNRLQKAIDTARLERDEFKKAHDAQIEEIKRLTLVSERLTAEVATLESEITQLTSR